ncbi:SPOR domain-containing protein [Nitrogeniibacter mangrovi]|uniref:SPOR domain-containing protein n=1 Tax=Nitrogeniibacter mangrovi TaxID=2016596 RepID=A0A6C1B1F4_9RHOO|nr:SPOR domain-containing protein [Nitrogeniibacter mangrovi]QID16745.1 SPOR domain-containing protein [Nitrogeniibacter mangrovi]
MSKTQSQEHPKTGASQRAVLFKRAGLAAALIVALLAGLAWFEREQAQPALPSLAEAPPPPLPDIPEPPHGAPPMPSQAEVEATVAAESGLTGGDAAAPELTAAPAVVAPEDRVDETPPPVAGAPRLVLGGEADKAEAPPPAAKSPPPPPAPAAKAAPAPVKNGYLVQLGVFSAPGNASALAKKVDALGIPAHIESRVVIGPFKNRAEADAARAKLKKSGLAAGIIVPSH